MSSPTILLGAALVAYHTPSVHLPRREALQTAAAAAALALPLAPPPTWAADIPALRAAWTATDGFNDTNFIAFDEGAYAAMRDDERRTPLFEKAIHQRLAAAPPNTLTVLDIGTGPYALLALAAAKAGAKKVYTVETSKEAAKRAREVLRKAGISSDVVEVIEGFSTAISLPEKIDVLVAEIAGSVASEEGAYATIRDAQARFMRNPSDPASYIPFACQTYAAPASYALHYALGPPQFDWGKLKEPVRLNCRDESLQLLAAPQLLEQIVFSDPALPASGSYKYPPLTWAVDADRVARNEKVYYEELLKEGAKGAEATSVSSKVSRSFSGIALWPRLVLDPAGTLIVESRGALGEHQKSHWQTVLPLMAGRPAAVAPSQTIRVAYEVDLRDGKPNTPLKYALNAELGAAVAAQPA